VVEVHRDLRVLHLEDDRRDADLVRDLLDTSGIRCNITPVQTREAFVDALDEGRFDLILADYSLPSFDGMSALKIARQRSSDVPFIFVSGTLGEEVAIDALKLGATDYVLKERLSRIVSAVRSAVSEAEHRGELQRAERDSKRSAALLAEAQRLSHTSSWGWAPASGKVTWSEEHYRLLGFEPDEVEASLDAFMRVVHEEDRTRVRNVLDEATRARRAYEMEYRVVRRDGTVRHLRSIGRPVPSEAGDVDEYIGTSADITDRVHAEEALRRHLWFLQSLDRINRAIQGTNDLERMMSDVLDAVLEVFACDRAWLVHPCDPDAATWRAVMEHTSSQFPGAFALGSDLPVDAEVATVFRAALATNDAVLLGAGSELPVPARLAEQFDIQSVIAIAVHPKVDQPYLFGLHQCSHARIWSAQEQRLVQEIGRRLADALTGLLMVRSLHDSERKLEEAQRVAHLGHWEWNFEARRVALSDEGCRIFGLLSHDLPAEPEHWGDALLNRIHPDDRAKATLAFRAAVRGGRQYELDYRIVRPNGEIRNVHSRAYVTRDEAGRPTRMFGMMQDVTEVRKLEERLRQAETMEAIGRFASGIVHDFNNVLGGILGYSEMLVRDAGNDTAQQNNARYVVTAATRGRELVDQILAYTRSQRTERVPTDVCEAVTEAVEIMRSALPSSIGLRIAVPDTQLMVLGDETQLHQVVMNLCSNSIHAMSESGGTLHVAVDEIGVDAERALSHGTLKSGRHVRVNVTDGGCGMDAATLARIFEPFFTTKGGGRGTGLGLALVYAIVNHFGGAIDVNSTPGAGSSFSIYLPALDVTGAATPE
jgi:PAS domain S-box-containing protein